ncbi:bifunctional 2-polyprenyl-6-hydroxyphenol methylase/3-demethylubiquinol 3-O-methyltransferase UbiG [Acetobacteraceae bacterium H6797]|nr:bifunctional 2-polyprenyl-6-hydroxyphenol methylase/3-demethylubiquinol 3-O-methyltransferase UbiG [Acetobacteraceae bacterium H6797]
MSTVLSDEVRKFDALADRWWDPKGPMAPLHAMNPARIDWIVARLEGRHGSLAGLHLLDVGCGAGLAAEALARRGATVTAIDAAPEAVAAARAHAAAEGVAVDYRHMTAEALIAEGERFDAVLSLEVVEHVADRQLFIDQLSDLVKPGGLVFLSTLNRTPRSWALAKLGAEYLLRMLPVGTHDWKMFVTPSELGAECRLAGLRVVAVTGLLRGLSGWRTGRDMGVNYMLAAERG